MISLTSYTLRTELKQRILISPCYCGGRVSDSMHFLRSARSSVYTLSIKSCTLRIPSLICPVSRRCLRNTPGSSPHSSDGVIHVPGSVSMAILAILVSVMSPFRLCNNTSNILSSFPSSPAWKSQSNRSRAVLYISRSVVLFSTYGE